ncbi:MAG: DUF4363 family protein [Clostridia bacterium]|nr:DUF4363 family protein [Clostridia bacterium]
MKVLWAAIAIFVAFCIVIGVHSYVMGTMGKVMNEKNQEVVNVAFADDWQRVAKLLDDIEEEWDKYRIWAALTISTDDIEQLEISLSQAKAFARLEQKSDFFGEFIMFSKLVEHIPHREGFHIEEIL